MKIGVLVVLATIWSACASAPSGQPQKTVTAADQKQAEDDVAAGDAAWNERAQQSKLEEAIRAWERAVAANPTDWKTWTKLCRGYYWLAEGYIAFEPNSDAAYLAAHEKGFKAGEQAMRHYSDKTRKQMELGAKLEDLAQFIDKDGVPALYWYGSCLGRWAKKQGTAKAVLHKDSIRKIQERARELDENYFYAAPIRYFGAFYAFAPSFAGGDVEKGRANFEDAIKRFPAYLGTRVLYADTYATKVQDADLFKRQLQMVLDERDDTIPEIVWENQVAKKQAKQLLGQMKELF